MLELEMFPNDYMNQFDPDELLKFTVFAKGEEMFYLDLKRKNMEVKGMWMVTAPDPNIDPIISVFITDPNNKLIFIKTKKSLGQFGFNSTVPGEYKIIFSNLRVSHNISNFIYFISTIMTKICSQRYIMMNRKGRKRIKNLEK